MNLIFWIVGALAFYYWGYLPMVAKGYKVEATFVCMVMTYLGLLAMEIRTSIRRVEVDTMAMKATLKDTAESVKGLGQFVIDSVTHIRR